MNKLSFKPISPTPSLQTLCRATVATIALPTLVACGSGGASSADNDALFGTVTTTTNTSDGIPNAADLDSRTPAETTLSQTQSIPDVNAQNNGIQNDESPSIGATAQLADQGDLIPVLLSTETDLDLEYASIGVRLIEQMNDSFILPRDIDVYFTDCGTANAFYVTPFALIDDLPNSEQINISAGGAVFMCHELTQLFSNFYTDKAQAASASLFVLMHEVGHALVNQLRLPVLGIEESYVDGMSAVFLGEADLSEGSVLAGWFFGSQSETPFFDTHRAGPQRLGDLACWGIGADLSIAEDPLVGSIAQQLILSGRNCEFEYNQQLGALNTVLGPHLRGEIADVFADSESLLSAIEVQ